MIYLSELDRNDLFKKKAKVNQIRNGIYSFISYFRDDLNKSVDETRDILREMGKNSAKSFYNYWKPESDDTLKIMREIHRVVFKTSANVREKDEYIVVINRSCPFCKYPRDVDLSGCEIIVGFIVEYFNLCSSTNTELNIPKLEGKVTKSRIYEEKFCQNIYKIIDRG